MTRELSPAQVRRTIDPDGLGLETTAQVPPLKGIIGQKRAVSALEFGLGIQEVGFNIYVAGPPGSGKMTTVQAFLDEIARLKPSPPDWCYVNDFDDPYQPKVLKLPAGRGRSLQQDMKSVIDHLRREVPKTFESDDYVAKRDEIKHQLEQAQAALLAQVQEHAAQAGFSIRSEPSGIVMIPLFKGRPLSPEDFESLPPQTRQEIQQRHEPLVQELDATLKQTRVLARGAQDKLQQLDKQVALYLVGGLIQDLLDKYQDLPEVAAYIRAAQDDILENLSLFQSKPPGDNASAGEEVPTPGPWLREIPFRKYLVNVLVDNSKRQGAPVVGELNPSYTNLFGRIEHEAHYGALYTDLTMIKAGALQRANGGYLVLPVPDLLRAPFSWDSLKMALRSGEIPIEDLGERTGLGAVKSLRPQPVPLQVKVLLVGSPLYYYALQNNDEDYDQLFKVKADFDTEMEASAENIQDFGAFVSKLCQKENLTHLDRTGLARLVEHALRLAEDQQKLSTHFGALADVIREASFIAGRDQAPAVNAGHIRQVLERRVYRSNLVQEHIEEMVVRGTLLIETRGAVTGQVNGLSVLSLGDYEFGKPSRITASVMPGRGAILDVEREVKLGGPLHSKGVMILSGYLAEKYAQDQPLTLGARLVFEQSYEGVDGDSASSAELYALLSALSRLPLKQGIAVTGSVNQHGEVQAIGGVNEKIEGFFDVCSAKGLTAEQGVVIPESNVQNLMLREDVVDAIRDGKFRVWGVTSIDEGIEILTGVPAGKLGADGNWPRGTVNDCVASRLCEFARCLREAAQPTANADGKGQAAAPAAQN